MSNDSERVVITVNDTHVASIQSVAAALRSAGMQISNVLPVGGIITGEVPQDKMDRLRLVRGVADVEIDDEMRAI